MDAAPASTGGSNVFRVINYTLSPYRSLLVMDKRMLVHPCRQATCQLQSLGISRMQVGSAAHHSTLCTVSTLIQAWSTCWLSTRHSLLCVHEGPCGAPRTLRPPASNAEALISSESSTRVILSTRSAGKDSHPTPHPPQRWLLWVNSACASVSTSWRSPLLTAAAAAAGPGWGSPGSPRCSGSRRCCGHMD